jgi:alpha-N-arabinofuranosidase
LLRIERETINTPVKATVLTADRMNAHNTFEAPFMVRPAAYDGVFIQKGKVSITMPPMSIISLSINQKEG